MLIRKRLWLNNVVLMALLLALVFGLGLSVRHMQLALKRIELAYDLPAFQYERLVFRTDYMRSGSERAWEQTLTKDRQIRGLLATMEESFEDPADRNTIALLNRNEESVNVIYIAILANRRAPDGAFLKQPLSDAAERRLVNQLQMRAYEATVLGNQVRESSKRQWTDALQTGIAFGATLVIFVAGVILLNSAALGQTITRRIDALRLAVARIGNGRFRSQIGLDGDDEFAELSAAFNAMGQRLDESHAALRASEAKYRGLFEYSPDAIFLGYPDGRVIEANPAACALLGMSAEEIVARGREGLADAPAVSSALGEREGHGGVRMADCAFIGKDGRSIAVEVNSTLLGEAGADRRSIVMARDITARRAAEIELKLAATVFQESGEAMLVTDEDNLIIAVNPAFTEITGYAADEVLGVDPRILKSAQHDAQFFVDIWSRVLASGHWKGEIWNRRKDGSLFAAQLSINTLKSADGAVYRHIGLISDITEKKQSDERIWAQANFDALTGLPNRRSFQETLQQEMRKARRTRTPLALMFLDIDHFKEINDSLGHEVGDLLLREAAARLSECVRQSDLVARLAGDEFTVLLTDLHDPADVDRVASNILKALARPFRLGDRLSEVSASVGIALYPDDAENVDDLIRNADKAMYAAKKAGRDRYHYFTPTMQEEAVARLRLIDDLRGALDRGQFELVFQPIVEIGSGKICKAEALIRWQHPVRGLINPLDFIPAAEDIGIINSFGNWVFGQAAEQAAKWRTSHCPDFQISINLSPAQLRDQGFSAAVWLGHLRELGLPPPAIVVEVTEGLLLDPRPEVVEQLALLRDGGMKLALDDFGAGHSPLACLQKYGIETLKIDRAFVRRIATDESDLLLYEAIIAMAKTLGVSVVAEGIETAEQYRAISGAGCDYGQGFFFAPPVPADQFQALIEAARARDAASAA